MDHTRHSIKPRPSVNWLLKSSNKTLKSADLRLQKNENRHGSRNYRKKKKQQKHISKCRVQIFAITEKKFSCCDKFSNHRKLNNTNLNKKLL